MALSWKARRRWSLFVLVVGLPVYVIVAVTVVNLLDRPPFLVEILIYVALGLVWALPFRFLFRGIGRADPAASDDPAPNSPAGNAGGKHDDP